MKGKPILPLRLIETFLVCAFLASVIRLIDTVSSNETIRANAVTIQKEELK